MEGSCGAGRSYLYFKTNEEAGALYGTEDLLKIHLVNVDLSTFIRNSDAVMAGMKPLPDSNTLKDIFRREIRKTKRMEYDLRGHLVERSSEGKPGKDCTNACRQV